MKGTNHEGISLEQQNYVVPAVANHGNLISIPVGGGLLGDWIAHENEAPYPEALVEWFLKGLCPPGGTVLDPFSGSGTTVATALKNGRSGIGMDIRTSQSEIGTRRLRGNMPLFAGVNP